MKQAEELALKSNNFKHVISINIENRHDFEAAIGIIDNKIQDTEVKVECLKIYAPKILQKSSNSVVESKAFSEQIITIVMNIAKALKPYDKVKIEQLIEIFDFNLSMAKRLLADIIKDNSID